MAGLASGNNPHVSTPASGANAQGANRLRTKSNDGLANYVTERCYYPDVTAPDRRAKIGDCVNTFQIGADEHHGKDPGAPAAAPH